MLALVSERQHCTKKRAATMIRESILVDAYTFKNTRIYTSSTCLQHSRGMPFSEGQGLYTYIYSEGTHLEGGPGEMLKKGEVFKAASYI